MQDVLWASWEKIWVEEDKFFGFGRVFAGDVCFGGNRGWWGKWKLQVEREGEGEREREVKIKIAGYYAWELGNREQDTNECD